MHVNEEEIHAFIFEHIDTVPHLEALLQVWNTRPRAWTAREMAARLFLEPEAAQAVLADLGRHGLVARASGQPDCYCYLASAENDRMVEALAGLYQRDLIRVSTAIHSKASSGVREFARAFYFRKGRKP